MDCCCIKARSQFQRFEGISYARSRLPHVVTHHIVETSVVFLLIFHLLPCFAHATLPTSYDWRDQGITLPPVRNQGPCGSSWAISAIDIVEIAIIRQYGEAVDLSEQWLVNCTQGSDGCNGGVLSWALNSLKCSASGYPDVCGDSGAVLEADFPYTGTDATLCGCPYSHPYCVESWGRVGGTPTPTDEQIKEAVYTYGPVACHMELYQDFYSYSSGVYTHVSGVMLGLKAMVIVGWGHDGQTPYWIVKNTWGPFWGEDGYCRIAFGTCKIGEYAAYVTTVSGPNHFCGEPGQVYLSADLNKDCYVGLSDLAIVAAQWLQCTDLSDSACSWDLPL